MARVHSYFCSLLLALALLLCCVERLAQADSPSPVKPPALGPTRQAIPHKMFQLGNGLRVILQEDHHSPFVTVCVVYHVGAFHETAGKSGLAHFFEHLMFEGSKATLPRDAHQVLQEMGAVTRNGTTSWHETVYYETVPAINLESALWMESDRMEALTAAGDSIKLGEVRDVVKNERRQRLETVPYGAAKEALNRVLFPASYPYSRTVVGSMADLDRATPKDMRAFYESWYGPNNATLVLVLTRGPKTRALVGRSPIHSGPDKTRPAPAFTKSTLSSHIPYILATSCHPRIS